MKYDLSLLAANSRFIKSKKKKIALYYRDEFVRDRDRILYSKEFRRLSGKTQVFISSYGDCTRNRLTHTLEVAQIAMTIAKGLNINEVLADAISLGHDVGHTPFGHAGERTLNYIMNGCIDCYEYNKYLNDDERGFKHNLQSVRVVSQLEEGYGDENTKGLNLSNYTLWGMMNHTKLTYKPCDYCNNGFCSYKNVKKECNEISTNFYEASFKENKILIDDRKDWTLEGIIVSVADEIAQRHHDIEDGIFAGLIDGSELCDVLCSNGFISEAKKEELKKKIRSNSQIEIIQSISETIIDFYIKEYINHLGKTLNPIINKYKKENKIKDRIINKSQYEGIRNYIYDYIQNNGNGKKIVENLSFNKKTKNKDELLKEFIKYRVHKSELTQNMDGKATFIIVKLVKAYLTNPQQLPDKTIISIVKEYDKKFKKSDRYIVQIGKARDSLSKLLKENTKSFRKCLLRKVVDYIAGMTDEYAIIQYEKLYGSYTPKGK